MLEPGSFVDDLSLLFSFCIYVGLSSVSGKLSRTHGLVSVRVVSSFRFADLHS